MPRKEETMSKAQTVLITGAAGNLGHKLRQHLAAQPERYSLRLLDLQARDQTDIVEADLSQWRADWVKEFQGVDTVVHLAADASPLPPWADLLAPNLEAVVNVYEAAAQNGVARVIYASSNHAMGAYKDIPEPHRLTAAVTPKPGTYWEADGQSYNSVPYGALKLVGERIGKCYVDARGLSVIGVRIGWVLSGDNRPQDIPLDEPWFKQMWLSNRDFCHLFECCIQADRAIGFAVVNGMSKNSGMRWDIQQAGQLIGYAPQDDVSVSDNHI
jgi:NAD+ dependent glucose-6-phosphate dehydrogenase